MNANNPAKIIRPQNEGYTIFKGFIGGTSISYLWVGAPGTYGIGQLQSTALDFQILEDGFVSDLGGTLNINGNTLLSSIHTNKTLLIKANSVITITIGLPINFECRFRVVGNFTLTLAASGTTITPNTILSFVQHESCLLTKDGLTQTYLLDY